MSRLIIYGEGNYAEQAYYYFTNDSEYEIVAFTADKASLNLLIALLYLKSLNARANLNKRKILRERRSTARAT